MNTTDKLAAALRQAGVVAGILQPHNLKHDAGCRRGPVADAVVEALAEYDASAEPTRKANPWDPPGCVREDDDEPTATECAPAGPTILQAAVLDALDIIEANGCEAEYARGTESTLRAFVRGDA